MVPLQLYFVRHGETAWSITGQHTGRTDLGLTTHGEDQARALEPRLRGIEFAHVLVSPCLRTRQTCALAGLSAASRLEPDLAEWDYGDYEGQRSIEIRTEHPDWNVWRDGCPDGETPTELCSRADRLIGRLAAMHGAVALFSHGQFGAALAARWIGLPLIDGQHFALHPASLSILGHEAAHWDRRMLELWNEIPASARSAVSRRPDRPSNAA